MTRKNKARIPVLVVDDDNAQLKTIADILETENLEPLCGRNAQEALQIFQKRQPNVAILDLRLPDIDGLELLRKLRKQNPNLKAIINTAYATVDVAVQAVNDEAFAFVRKMGNVEELLAHVHRAIHTHLAHYSRKLEQEVRERTKELSGKNDELRRKVNERNQALEALRKSEEKYRRLFESSKDAIYISTPDGKFLDINPAGVELLGLNSKEEVLKMNITEELYLDPKTRQRFEEIMVREGHVKDFDAVLKRKDGRVIHMLETSTAIVNDKGRVIGYRGIMRDISRQKELERQVMQMQKMEAVGTLAGGIAHDFNNILAAILGYAEMAVHDLEGHRSQADIYEILKAVHRAKKLIQQILTFCHGTERNRRPLQVQQIIKETIHLLRATLPASITVHQDVQDVGGAIMGDPTQIHQVVMNLCTNAYQAMRATGGDLYVSLSRTAFETEYPTNTRLLPAGEYLVLTVSDTGEGMTSDVVEKIFDPFFTTKSVGEGSGMGLSVVHGIVRSHDGAISVRSQPGEGSTFEVYFPFTHDAGEDCMELADSSPAGNENILFVDDEQTVVNVGRRILERYGYHVTSKTSGVEALEEFRNDPYRFDIVITDQNMPGKSGVELAGEMMQLRQDVRIVLMTGYSDDVDEHKALELGIKEYIMKPFMGRELGSVIRKVLDKGGNTSPASGNEF